MEHSWIGNDFVHVVEDLIAEGGAWHGDRIVWAGDYADVEKNRKNNLYTIVGDNDKNKIKPEKSKTKYRYVINSDTKEFVDVKKIPISSIYEEAGKEYPFVIHPLPLLTCEGNNRGGGDFHKDDPIIGKWARNRVTVSNTKPAGFTEIEFNLFEGHEPVILKNKKTTVKS